MATGRCAMIAVDTDLTRIEIGPEKNYLRKKKPIEERKLPLPNRLIISFAHMSSLPITVVQCTVPVAAKSFRKEIQKNDFFFLTERQFLADDVKARIKRLKENQKMHDIDAENTPLVKAAQSQTGSSTSAGQKRLLLVKCFTAVISCYLVYGVCHESIIRQVSFSRIARMTRSAL